MNAVSTVIYHDVDAATLAGEAAADCLSQYVPDVAMMDAGNEGNPDEEADTETVEAEPVPALASVTVPVRFLRAALLCASKEETRYYLNGVALHRDGNAVRMISTDGNRMLMLSHTVDGQLPEWLNAAPVILPAEGLAKRLSLIESEAQEKGNAECVLSFAVGAPKILVSDPLDLMTFRMTPIDGTYPDYQRVLQGLDAALGERAFEAGDAPMFNPTILKTASDVANALGGSPVALFQPPRDSDDGVAGVVTFPAVPGAALVLMPVSGKPAITGATLHMLAPGMKGTLAAIKANLTRTETRIEAGDPESERLSTKCDEYRRRIAEIESAMTLALPAPEPEAEPETETEPKAEEPAAPEPVEAAPVVSIKTAKTNKAKRGKGKTSAPAEGVQEAA